MDALAPSPLLDPPLVRGAPIVGSAFDLARDPARFFVNAYREYGPAFRVKVFGKIYGCIAGVEAANFLTTREGRESLRSKEFWQGLVDEYGATRTLTGEDGAIHQQLRGIMRRGYSREAVAGRYNELVTITDRAISRRWHPGATIPVVEALQYMVVEQLGDILTGAAPLEYVKDIRTNILYILNCLVTRQRPRFLLWSPRYQRAKKRVNELGQSMIADMEARAAKGELPANLLGDIFRAHQQKPDLIPANDLVLTLTGPYVAGLDTVANTTSSFVYRALKHPEVLARVQAEADALFAKDSIDEADLLNLPAINGAIQETMRLHPIAVAQMRTATKDFEFQGYRLRAGEMIFIGTSVPHFMEEYFPNPDSFDIDRYEKPRQEHMRPGVYSPFGRGPHTCLGKTIADVLMSLTLARLFHKLDLELVPADYVLKVKTAPTPGPSMKFQVRVKGVRH
ncbi:MAG TPA: cytochrome P450 [Acetobacteraceae bacterium]|nr:cytochrome P450 [Acetobacteraceae bacterium]